MQKMPKARRRGLIVKELPDETLIYDEDGDKAHCLNHTAAGVWKHCDGRTTIAATCRSLSRDFGVPVDEQVVWYALDQFGKDHLLEERIKVPTSVITRMNRRQMVGRLGFAAVVAAPLVISMLAPTAAQAGGSPPNCILQGGTCTVSAQCCSSLCSGGTCA